MRMSLEEIFLQVTTDETEENARPAADANQVAGEASRG